MKKQNKKKNVNFSLGAKADMSKKGIFRCGFCKNANYYQCYWWYPFLDPACCITKKSISHDQIACENFELMGRLCR